MQRVSCFLQLLMQHHDDISNYLESFMSSLSCSSPALHRRSLYYLTMQRPSTSEVPPLTHWSCPCPVATLRAVRPWFLILVGLSSHCRDRRYLHIPPQCLVTCFHFLPAHMKLQTTDLSTYQTSPILLLMHAACVQTTWQQSTVIGLVTCCDSPERHQTSWTW